MRSARCRRHAAGCAVIVDSSPCPALLAIGWNRLGRAALTSTSAARFHILRQERQPVCDRRIPAGPIGGGFRGTSPPPLSIYVPLLGQRHGRGGLGEDPVSPVAGSLERQVR